MELVICPRLEQPWQTEGVWRLLQSADREFVPHLSQRESTYQGDLSEGKDSVSSVPAAYFEELKTQPFLLAVQNGQVAGFLSFRCGYVPPPLAGKVLSEDLSLYITTIIVDRPFRRQGIARQLYHLLFSRFSEPGRMISTRTWHTNRSHIGLLLDLGFQGPVTIPDDRGPGIDTVYYYRFF